jgi:glycosyltransferase involved in cell wall biosynthesis
MANVLVISHKVPWPLDDGHSLRVFKLSQHLDARHTCHLACLPLQAGHAEGLRRQDCFASVTLLPPWPARRHWRRLLRRGGNRDFFRLAYPAHFAGSQRILQDLVDHLAIDVVVASLVLGEEYMRPLQNVAKLLDQYDCATLAVERMLEARRDLGFVQRLRLRSLLHRNRATESDLARRCDLLTAISPPDVARLRSLNPDGPPIELVPNGVDLELLDRAAGPEAPRRAVAFWGNLSFPVNRLAVEHFYRDIWLPRLQPEGVRWAIVGPRADPWIRQLATKHPEIEVPGFVPDLFAYLAPYPVMVNPMLTGTGLKNKVLEAMAAGKAVVTTSLGVDAFPFVDGVHGRVADSPAAFAAAVLETLDDAAAQRRFGDQARELVRSSYTWEAVGGLWSSLLAKLGGVQSR